MREGRGSIALIAQAAGQEAYRKPFLSDARDVQGAAFAVGVPLVNLELPVLIDPRQFTPKNYPVVVSVDPAGEYPHTLEKPGDGQAALVRYLERGGVLVALSHGGAFRAALIRAGDGLRRSADEVQTPRLLDLLGLATVRPREKPIKDFAAQAFDHPPNEPREIFFERASEAPRELQGLPRHVPLVPMHKARFYPMVSTQQAATVIYQLKDETGEVYGPALSLVPKGRGTLVIIDHLLWHSRPDEQPFADRILPAVLRWALETGQP
jgi:hypothetical protein